MKSLTFLFLLLLSSVLHAQTPLQDRPPSPLPPLPEPRQVEWQQMETYAFIHFGPNTFADREWGYGDADPSIFNPPHLDCRQWARVCKAAGMKGIILTAKHHDGFCLWQTQYTDYSIRNAPYRQGRGDVVAELAEACREYGLKLGLYLSPWDRHQASYATPLYREYFHAQLRELLTNYGDIFEVWFDGANGGDGYYGGACETRTIDRRTYYDFPRAWQTVDSLQPGAVCFSDAGPGCRWVGNEQGYASATNWSFVRSSEVYPGYEDYKSLQQGHADGDQWAAAECNTSIRPGWFYHSRDDDRVKSIATLVDLYYRSVGRNGTFLLNFPVAPSGLIHPVDSQRAVDFHKQITAELSHNLASHAKVYASNSRGRLYKASLVTDGHFDTYWATSDGINTGTITLKFRKPVKINRLMLQEYIPLGQRVQSFSVSYLDHGGWNAIDAGEETTTIGYKRILRFPTVTTRQLRISFNKSRAPLCISEIAAFFATTADSVPSDTDWMETRGYDYSKTISADRVVMDLGNEKLVGSLHYKPSSDGIITHYQILAGCSPDSLTTVATGEFSNIRNNPVMQDVYFTPRLARYVVLRALKTLIPNQPLKYDALLVK